MKRDIENLLKKLKCFDSIPEPVSIFMSYIDIEDFKEKKYTNHKTILDLNSKNIDKLVDLLNNNKIKTVKHGSKLARNPENLVVSKTGIETPFYNKYEAYDNIKKICHIINNSEFVLPLSYPSALPLSQLSQSIKKEYSNYCLYYDNVKNPDPKEIKDIEERRGDIDDFIQSMISEANKNASEFNPRDVINGQAHIFSNNDELYSGRRLLKEPENTQARYNYEGRMIIYATDIFEDALKYSGYGTINDNTKKYRNFSFIHIHRKLSEEELKNDMGMETGGASLKDDGQRETSIVPWHNERLGIIIYLGNNKYFKMPDNNKRWEDFKNIFKISYTDENKNMIARRNTIYSNSYKNDDKAVSYDIYGNMKDENIFYTKTILSRSRNKLAKRIDKKLSMSMVEEISIPEPIKDIEISVSKFLNKLSNNTYFRIAKSKNKLKPQSEKRFKNNISNQSNKNSQNNDTRNNSNER